VTLQDLLNQTWTWLDDLQGTYFLQSQLTYFANNAQRECQKEMIQAGQAYYMTCSTTNMILSQGAYALPSDFLSVAKLEVIISGFNTTAEISQRILPMTPIEIDSLSVGPATPQGYYLKKNCLVLAPVPDSTYVMRLTYNYRVQDMTSVTQVPDCPLEYHEYLAVLMTLDGLYKDQRDPGPMMAKKEQYKELMRQTAPQRQQDGPRRVVSTLNNDVGFYF
jgi:hypothetical protein